MTHLEALTFIRDRYVKKLAGKDKPVCTLCGRDDGTHDEERNCGIAAAALDSGTPTPNYGCKHGEIGQCSACQKEMDAATPAAPMCAPWCGKSSERAEPSPCGPEFMRCKVGRTSGRLAAWTCFCSPACRDAGRPLHPTTPTPTEDR